MYQLVFYVPLDHCETVKEAIFAKGAGQLGDYQGCAWQVVGQGQFEPTENANPFMGTVGKAARIEEVRVECVVKTDLIRTVLEALVAAHPFEEPAYGVWPLMTLDDFPPQSPSE